MKTTWAAAVKTTTTVATSRLSFVRGDATLLDEEIASESCHLTVAAIGGGDDGASHSCA